MDDFTLLSADDRAYAESTGIRCEDAPELFSVQDGGTLVLSVKGLQFIKYACAVHQLPFRPAALQTQKDLFRLAIDMSRVRIARLQTSTARQLRSGTLPAQERDFARAVLDADLHDALDAAGRHDDCTAAGDNVIPLGAPRRPD